MKYINNNHTINLTTMYNLQESKNNDYKSSLEDALEKAAGKQGLNPYDRIIIIDRVQDTYDSYMGIIADGAGYTYIGGFKQDNKMMYDKAKFRKANNHKYKPIDISSVDNVVEDCFGKHMRFKDDADVSDYIDTLSYINYGMQRHDQSLDRYLAMYAVHSNVAISKGCNGVTRNCRNVWTMDCDLSIEKDILYATLSGQDDCTVYDIYPKEIADGLLSLHNFIYKVYELCSSLPHIIYNEESGHFQLQYLLKRPIYAYVEEAISKCGSAQKLNKDACTKMSYEKSMRSKLEDVINAASKKANVLDVFRGYLKNDDIIEGSKVFVVYRKHPKSKYVHAKVRVLNVDDFISSDIPMDIKNIMSREYVPYNIVSKSLYECNRGDNLRITPEYMRYKNASRVVRDYINNGLEKNDEVLDSNYTGYFSKSMSIGTDLSELFDIAPVPDTKLSHEYMICREDGNLYLLPFNLMRARNWEQAKEYALDNEFVAYLGSLRSLDAIWEDDVMEKYEDFKKHNKSAFSYNLPYSELIKASSSDYDSLLSAIYDDMGDDIDIEDLAIGLDADSANMINEVISSNPNIPDIVSSLLFKYLKINDIKQYINYKAGLLYKIEMRKLSRYGFNFTLVSSLCMKAMWKCREFCNACLRYKKGKEESILLGEIDTLMRWVFNDIVKGTYNDKLPGTKNPGGYEFCFNTLEYISKRTSEETIKNILSKSPARFRKRMAEGYDCKTLLSGATRISIITRMYDMLCRGVALMERENEVNNIKMTHRQTVKKAWDIIEKLCSNPMDAKEIFKNVPSYKATYYQKEEELKESGEKTIHSRKHNRWSDLDRDNKNIVKSIEGIPMSLLKTKMVTYYCKQSNDMSIVEFCLDTTCNKYKKGVDNVDSFIEALQRYAGNLKDIKKDIDRKGGSYRLWLSIGEDSIIDIYNNDSSNTNIKSMITANISLYKNIEKYAEYLKDALKYIEMSDDECDIVNGKVKSIYKLIERIISISNKMMLKMKNELIRLGIELYKSEMFDLADLFDNIVSEEDIENYKKSYGDKGVFTSFVKYEADVCRKKTQQYVISIQKYDEDMRKSYNHYITHDAHYEDTDGFFDDFVFDNVGVGCA